MGIKQRALIALCLVAAVVLTTSLVSRVNYMAQPAMINSVELPGIIIDAGHGGVDGGGSGYGAVEKDINLAIAMHLRDMMVALGFDVTMIRETDISIHDPSATTIRQKKHTDLVNRLNIINSSPGSIFVSIHQNMYHQSRYRGTQVFYAPHDPDSRLLAESIQGSVRRLMQPDNDRSTRETNKDIYILYNAQIPAVMVECGFLTNPEDAYNLQNPEYQMKMSFAIMSGILNFI